MPIFSFRCLKCGKVFEQFVHISTKVRSRKCKCGGKIIHDFVADHKGGNVDSQMKEYSFEGDKGTRLYPCAVLNEEQLAKARKQHPGFDWRQHNGAWLPVIKNRTDKLRFLKQRNWCELD